MNLEIVRDLEILRKPCREVALAELQNTHTQELIDSMLWVIGDYNKTARMVKGRWTGLTGLAANQVGSDLMILIGYLDGKNMIPVINPRLTNQSGQRRSTEGCVSLPLVQKSIIRADLVDIEAFDRDGKVLKMHLRGEFAAIVQHENDHLNGRLITDRH